MFWFFKMHIAQFILYYNKFVLMSHLIGQFAQVHYYNCPFAWHLAHAHLYESANQLISIPPYRPQNLPIFPNGKICLHSWVSFAIARLTSRTLKHTLNDSTIWRLDF